MEGWVAEVGAAGEEGRVGSCDEDVILFAEIYDWYTSGESVYKSIRESANVA